MNRILNYLLDKKIWVWRIAALTCFPAYYFTKDMAFVVILWIQLIGIEVVSHGQKEKEIKEKNEIIKWQYECTQEDAHNFRVVRNKLREEIKKLNEEVAKCKIQFEEIGKQYIEENEDNFELLMDLKESDDFIEEMKEKNRKLEDELYAMKMAAEGRKKRTPKPIQEPKVLSPVEPELVPEPEPMQAVIEETEPQPTPVFNDTAVMETKTEEVTTVVKTKKAKAPSATAFTEEQITRYTKMIQDKEPRKVILATMMGEAGINEGAANNRYYALKEKIQKQKITDSIQAYNNNAVTVIKMEPNAKPLPRSIQAELDAMPVYDTIKAFKNAVCENELLKGYSIAELKEPYRSHRPDQVKWS